MNKKQLRVLRKKIFVIGVPTVVRFKTKISFRDFKATKGTEVVKWSDVLKVNRKSQSQDSLHKEEK
jgi:hypothetical protein